MSYLVLMPFTYAPFKDACLATMDDELIENTYSVDQTVKNIGAAGAYNVGARLIIEKDIDWLITLSPSTRFGPQGGKDFVKYLEEQKDEAWIVESLVPTGWHFIAWNKKLFQRIGFWDENFYPVYGEDADISYRALLAIEEDKIPNPWRNFPTDAWLTMQGYSARLAGIDKPQIHIWDYYQKKWGGLPGHEMYKRPFNDETKLLSYWTV